MPLRPPPGRSGRVWLARRLATATRAAELLDQKLRALAAEEGRLAAAAAAVAADWDRTARAAERWSRRSVLIGGQRQLQLVRVQTRAMASAEVRWRSWMGVTYPVEATVRPGRPGPSALGGTSALDVAAGAGAEALAAGVRHAAASRALELVRAELSVTRRRQRVLERRWAPLLEATLSRLQAALDEVEREDGVRLRWLRVTRATQPSPPPRAGGGGAKAGGGRRAHDSLPLQ